MSLFRSAKLVQIFLLSSFFCSKLTRYFTSEFFLKSLEKFLIAGVLLTRAIGCFNSKIIEEFNKNTVRNRIDISIAVFRHCNFDTTLIAISGRDPQKCNGGH
jgi:hypothetical protein